MGNQIQRAYRQTIESPPDVVFPLLCPVREAEWLDGWDYTMHYSATGLGETGAVFSTPYPGEPDTVWLITRHDIDAGEIQFVRVTPDSRASTLDIKLSAAPQNQTFVDISYVYTAIAPDGEDFLQEYTEEAFVEGVKFWEESMNHFLRTGEVIPGPPH